MNVGIVHVISQDGGEVALEVRACLGRLIAVWLVAGGAVEGRDTPSVPCTTHRM